MTTTKTKIFLTGATGYIGSSVLERLIDHPDAQTFDITILVRNAEKAKRFKDEFGLNAVVGGFNDVQLLEDLTADADVVIDTVDADALEATKIMLRGLKRRFQQTGNPAIYIHTSGTGVFSDDAAGLVSTDTVWDDANPDQLEQLPPTALHRDVDLEIIQADKDGYVKAYLIVPSTIYGVASGKFIDSGLANKHSIQIPALINASLDRKEAGIVGKGANIWPNVHIDDVAELYIVLFNAIRTNPDKIGHGREGFYLGISDEHKLYDVSKELARVMVELGKTSNPEPTVFTPDEINKYFNGSDYLGSNSRGIANRSHAIGWKPTRTTKDFIASIKAETEEIIKSGHSVALR